MRAALQPAHLFHDGGRFGVLSAVQRRMQFAGRIDQLLESDFVVGHELRLIGFGHLRLLFGLERQGFLGVGFERS